MEITIRKADAADLDAVVRVYEHVYDAEEAGPAQVGWVRGVYPVRSTAEAALVNDPTQFEQVDETCGSGRVVLHLKSLGMTVFFEDIIPKRI